MYLNIKNKIEIILYKFIKLILVSVFKRNGDVLPLYLLKKLDKNLIDNFARDINSINIPAIFVTGTNGKTTTANLIASGLNKAGMKVCSNINGANMTNGIFGSVIGCYSFNSKFNADILVIETDEKVFPYIISKINPALIVITNFYRDQLDRYGEVNTTMLSIKKSIESLKTFPVLILPSNEPLASFVGFNTKNKKFYFNVKSEKQALNGNYSNYNKNNKNNNDNSNGKNDKNNNDNNDNNSNDKNSKNNNDKRNNDTFKNNMLNKNFEDHSLCEREKKNDNITLSDAISCPQCGNILSACFNAHYTMINYYCNYCGYKNTAADVEAELIGNDYIAFNFKNIEEFNSKVKNEDFNFMPSSKVKNNDFNFKPSIQGYYNILNYMAAFLVLKFYCIDDEIIKRTFENYFTKFGRSFKKMFQGIECSIDLVKNPSGFNNVLEKIFEKDDCIDALFAFSDRDADGRDVSWIWDVNFEKYMNKFNNIIITGLRPYDMAIRLKTAGIDIKKIKVNHSVKKAFNEIINSISDNNYCIDKLKEDISTNINNKLNNGKNNNINKKNSNAGQSYAADRYNCNSVCNNYNCYAHNNKKKLKKLYIFSTYTELSNLEKIIV
jgi:UDP-N-acetylmuramyl tripeptide synthase